MDHFNEKKKRVVAIGQEEAISINYDKITRLPNTGYAHLTIKILAGRTDENKNQLGNEILEVMGNLFTSHKSNLNLQLSVEVTDLDKHYFKMIVPT